MTWLYFLPRPFIFCYIWRWKNRLYWDESKSRLRASVQCYVYCFGGVTRLAFARFYIWIYKPVQEEIYIYSQNPFIPYFPMHLGFLSAQKLESCKNSGYCITASTWKMYNSDATITKGKLSIYPPGTEDIIYRHQVAWCTRECCMDRDILWDAFINRGKNITCKSTQPNWYPPNHSPVF